MSLENLKEYARRCASEPELRARAKEIGASDAEEHMRHASSLGLDWTMDDMFAFRKEVVDAEGEIEELSEEDLEKIAGGALTVTGIIVGVAIVGAGVAGIAGAAVAGTAIAGTAAASGSGGW